MKLILGKLHKIMSEVKFIGKDKKNEFHNYKYASEQTIKETLHPILVANKVLFTLEAKDIVFSGMSSKTKPDGSMTQQKDNVSHISFIYHFFDVESGEELSGQFMGSGEDALDKGTYKAITGAIKYILTSTFLIPTGDDPEDSKNETKPQNPAAKVQTKSVSKTTAPTDYIAPELLVPCAQGHERIYKAAGVSQAGKPYKAFYPCTGGRNCLEKPIWPEDAEQFLKTSAHDVMSAAIDNSGPVVGEHGEPIDMPF